MAKKSVKKVASAKVAKVEETKAAPKKSELIREYLAANPEAKNKAVAEALAAHGVKASDVAAQKTQMKKKAGGIVKAAKSPAKATANGSGTIQDLLTAKQFAAAVGGIEKAKEILTALETLVVPF